MTEIIFVYITTESQEQARAIGQQIVSERLAACANILAPMQSIYWWEGQIQSAEEWVVILKTTQAQFVQLEARVRELHTYTNPCIVALPIIAGSAAYLSWVKHEAQVRD